MSKALPLVLLALTLAGCKPPPPPSKLPTPPLPPADAVQPCVPLPLPGATAGDIVQWISTVSKLYVDCDGKRQLLVEAWPK